MHTKNEYCLSQSPVVCTRCFLSFHFKPRFSQCSVLLFMCRSLSAHIHSLQVDRLMELHFKYLEAVQQADKRIEGEKHVSLVVFPPPPAGPPTHSSLPPTRHRRLRAPLFCDDCSSPSLHSAGPISLKGLISLLLVAIEKPHPGENCTMEKQPGLRPSVQTWALQAAQRVRVFACV